MHLDKDKLKQSLILIALFALGGFLFWWLRGFLSTFLAAVIFYILLRGPFHYLTEDPKRKWNRTLAAIPLMLFSFIVLVLPILLVSLMLAGKISFLMHHYRDILLVAQNWSAQVKDYWDIDILSQETVIKLTNLIANIFPKFISATANALLDIFIMYFLLYFMLANSRAFEKAAKEFLPFKDENNNLLLRELQKQTIANSIGIVVLSVIQAVVSGIGYGIFGVQQPVLWALLTGIGSAIPVVGMPIVWVPVCIFLYASGHQWECYAVAIYCIVVLGAVENIFRIVVLKKLGDVHPLITFFGVIMGLELFGIVGIIFGPLLISYFILLFEIYHNEYQQE